MTSYSFLQSKTNAIFFLPSLAGGGAEKVFVDLANHFAMSGRRIMLVCATAEGPLLNQVSPLVKLVDLKAKRTILASRALARLIRQHSPDVLFSSMTHANVAMLVAAAFAKYTGKLIVQEVALLSRGRETEGRRGLIIKRLIPYLYPRGRCIAVSELVGHEVEAIVRRSGFRVEVLPNPINLDLIQQKAAVSVTHPWFADPDPVVLGVGRLSPEKDFSTLLRAISILRRKLPARLILIGEGGLRDILSKEIADLGLCEAVDMIGHTDNPWHFMANASLTAVSSVAEGFSLVLVEALACGCPVVSTDCGSSPREILRDGQLGPLVPVGNAEALAVAMHSQILKPRAASALRQAAQRYSLPEVAKTYAKLLFN